MRAAVAARRHNGTTTRQDPITDKTFPRKRTSLTMPAFTTASGSGLGTDATTAMPGKTSSQRIRHFAAGTTVSNWMSLGGAVDFSARNHLLWFMREDTSNATLRVDNIRIDLSSDGGATTGATFNLKPGTDRHINDYGRWMAVEVPTAIAAAPIGSASAFTMPLYGAQNAAPNWSAITHIRYGMTSVSKTPGTVAQATLWFGAHEAIAKPPRPIVTFVTDRFDANNYTYFIPPLEAKGWRATVRGQVGQLIDLTDPSLMTLAQAQTLYANGHDIGIYDYPGTGFTDGTNNFGTDSTTPWSLRSKATTLANLQLAQQRLIENGMRANINQLVGQARKLYNDGYTDIVKPLFSYVDIPINDEYPAFWPPVDWMRVPNKIYIESVDNADAALSRIMQTINRGIANNEWITLLFHDVDTHSHDGFTITPTNYQTIVDYIAAQGVTVRTVSQVMHGQV